MFSEVTLAPEIEDFLRSLDVPVRVLDGCAGRLEPSPNWRGHARAAGHSRRECVDEGLTIVSWGSDHDSSGFTYVEYLSGDACTDGRTRIVSREFITDERRDERSYMPPVTHGDNATLARVNPDRRIVWFSFPLAPYAEGGLSLERVDLYKILGEPIMRVLGADRLPRTTERARELFLENAVRQQDGPAARLERRIRDLRDQIASHAESVRLSYATVRGLESELAVQRRVTTVCRARLEERWDALVAHPMLTRVSDDGSALVLTTTPLDIEDPNTGARRYLGVIDIRLSHGDHGLSLTLTNVDNPKGVDDSARAHPHCYQHGAPCWGGSECHAGELLASLNLPAILEFTLQYLQSYNPSDSWGQYATLWGFDGEYVECDENEDECMCSDCLREREEDLAA